MDHVFTPKELERVSEGRESFSGLLLTDKQYYEVTAITGILERSLHERGAYQKTLDHYSVAYASSNGITVAKANSTIWDIYKIRTGHSLKQTLDQLRQNRDQLFDRENNPAEAERRQAYNTAVEVGQTVEHGTKITFNRALAFEASQLASELGITDRDAKTFMAQNFKEIENKDFYEWGKELDEKYYRPQIEAEKLERQAQKTQTRSYQPSMT